MKKITQLLSLLSFLLFLSGPAAQSQQPTHPAFQVKVTGQGQPMLLIPGATCSGNLWDETVARYSTKYQCHVLTLAGYAGAASVETKNYLDFYQAQIIQYVQKEKLQKVILVGHSIGGFLSLKIASVLKDHLQKVVIIDALPFYALTLNPGAKAGFDEQQAKNLLASYNQMDQSQLHANQLATARSLCADSTKWNLIASWGAKSDRKTMAYTMMEMIGQDIRQTIAAIQVPVLVMAAFAPMPDYPQFSKEYVQSTFEQQYSQCKTCEVHVTSSARHFIMYDAPQWYFKEIDTFISAL